MHRGIGHPLRAADHAARKILANDIAAFVDFEKRG